MDETKLFKDTCYLRVRLVVLKCLGIILLFKFIREMIRWIANSNWNFGFTHLHYELCENITFSWIMPTALGLMQLILLYNIFRKINYINYTIKECRFLRAWMVIPFIFVISNMIEVWIVRFIPGINNAYINVTICLYYILVLYASLIFCILFKSKVTYMYTIIFLVFIFGFYLLFPYINCIFEVTDGFYASIIVKKFYELTRLFYSGFDKYNAFFVANVVLLIDEKLLKLISHKIKSGLSYIRNIVKGTDRL